MNEKAGSVAAVTAARQEWLIAHREAAITGNDAAAVARLQDAEHALIEAIRAITRLPHDNHR
jgi:hypothetical protein